MPHIPSSSAKLSTREQPSTIPVSEKASKKKMPVRLTLDAATRLTESGIRPNMPSAAVSTIFDGNLELLGGATLSVQVDLNEWNAETLRLTLFPREAVAVAGLSWWESVVGEAPETQNLRPRESRLEESGRIYDGKCNLTLRCEPTRVDWLLTPVIAADQELTEFPSFGKLPEALELYRRLLVPWLAHAPTLKRIAFGCIVTRPSEQREEGYRWISGLLPSVILDPEGSSDFHYSINRPRPTTTGIEGLIINRVSKWGVSKLHSLQLKLPHGSEKLVTGELFACRLELDTNTAAEFAGELSADDSEQLIHELIDLGVEIATVGDVP
jgi:hypothetical protein